MTRPLLCWALALLLGACSADTESSAAGEESSERACRDGRDNDGDGAIDCDDESCAGTDVCRLGAPEGDASSADAGTDAMNPDTGSPDAADPDAADPDAASPDAGGDTSSPDASADAGAEEDTVTPPVGDPRVRSCLTRIEHVAPSAGSVQIAGPFTDWASAPRAMTRTGDTWAIELDLPAGEHAYKFITDGVWDWDGSTEVPLDQRGPFYTQWVDGSENRSVIVGDCGVPRLQTLEATSDAEGVSATFAFLRGADNTPLDPSSVVVTVGGAPAPEGSVTIDEEASTIRVDAEGLPLGKHSVRVWASDEAARPSEEEPAYVPLWVEEEPYEWRDATMYFVFTDRFRDGDVGADVPIAEPIPGVPEIANYQGGDFLGVIQAIEEGYFEALGVDLLWLSPVTENPEGNFIASDRVNQFSGFHGYWPTHARQIEFRWGDVFADADTRFREMIDLAHENGIRVLLDIPLNHVHEQHEYIERFPEWFTADPCPCTTDPGPCNWDSLPGTLYCWFIDYLPDLDFKNHAIVQQMAADVEYLVTEYDVDAFRIDAAKHMDHVIMQRVALRLEERFTQQGGLPFYLVGETYTGGDGHGLIMDYVREGELDGQFDFPLLYPIRDVFAFDSADFATLADRRRLSEQLYGDAYEAMSPFLGNHDIPRFATYLYGSLPDPWAGVPDPMAGPLDDANWNTVNRMSMGFAYVLTQPGIPLIYYGDEIGLYGGGDPDNRRMMTFAPFLSASQSELLGRVQAIGRARRDNVALRRGRFQELWVDRGNGGNLYVYARITDDGRSAIVAMNKGVGGIRQVPVPAELGLDGTRYVDALGTDRTLTISANNATIALDTWEYVIWVEE